MSLHQGEVAASAGVRTPRDVTNDGPAFRIARNGDWFHGDVKIERVSLARLFASILYREADGSYWLKNPAEICHVTVEDAPYVASHLDQRGGDLFVTTTLDETICIDAAHPLTMRSGVPYIEVRHGCTARASTQLYYDLVTLADLSNGRAIIRSGGQVFDLGTVD